MKKTIRNENLGFIITNGPGFSNSTTKLVT